MKVRVTYTETFSAEDLRALERYHGHEVTRDELRQLLTDLGEMGVEEQVVEGQSRLDHSSARGER